MALQVFMLGGIAVLICFNLNEAIDRALLSTFCGIWFMLRYF